MTSKPMPEMAGVGTVMHNEGAIAMRLVEVIGGLVVALLFSVGVGTVGALIFDRAFRRQVAQMIKRWGAAL